MEILLILSFILAREELCFQSLAWILFYKMKQGLGCTGKLIMAWELLWM
jgi:hypothetical protein